MNQRLARLFDPNSSEAAAPEARATPGTPGRPANAARQDPDMDMRVLADGWNFRLLV